MKYLSVAAVIALNVFLSACGGGGGAGFLSPPPEQPRNASLVNIQYKESFQGAAARMKFHLSDSTGQAENKDNIYTNDMLAVQFDPATKSYTLTGSDVPWTQFGAAQRDSALSDDVLTVYQDSGENRNNSAILFNPGAQNSALVLTYTTYGSLQSVIEREDGLDANLNYMVFGIRTPDGSVPRVGSASYTTRIDGVFAGTGGIYALYGDSSFSANFAASTVSISMSPIGQNIDNGSILDFGTFTVAGEMGTLAQTRNQWHGSTPLSSGSDRLSIAGHFFGPAADEIGGTFTLIRDTGVGAGVGVGAIVGKRN